MIEYEIVEVDPHVVDLIRNMIKPQQRFTAPGYDGICVSNTCFGRRMESEPAVGQGSAANRNVP